MRQTLMSDGWSLGGLMAAMLVAAVGATTPAQAQCVTPESRELFASMPTPGAGYGRAVAASGDVMVIGAYNAGSSGPYISDGPGAATVYRLVGGSWAEEENLTPADLADIGWFGYSVDVSGDLAIVSARGDFDPNVPSGSAYVFRYDGRSWTEEAKLVPADAARDDEYGTTVAISGDVAVVGAPFNSLTEDGWAYVFRFNGSEWVEEQKLFASNGDESERNQFGISVDVSGDAIVVGAWNHGNVPGGTIFDGMGAAYIFRFDGNTWVEEQILTSTPLPGQRDRFGKAVAISEDATAVAIGTEPISSALPIPVGAAYVFRHGGTGWNQEAKLVSSDAEGGDRFGTAVSISGDIVLVGAWGEYSASEPCSKNPPDPDLCNAGSAYVFENNGDGQWFERAKLVGSDVAEDDLFSWSVAVSGSRAVIGSWRNGSAGLRAGSAYTLAGLTDCDGNGTLDVCDIASGAGEDSNGNGALDGCDRAACAGDVNGDRAVDLTDLAVLLSGFEAGATLAEGDVDGDGDVDLTDLAMLLAHFDAECP